MSDFFWSFLTPLPKIDIINGYSLACKEKVHGIFLFAVNYDQTINEGDPLEFNVLSQLTDGGYCRFTVPNVDGNTDNIESGFIIGDPILNGFETEFVGRPGGTWKYQWIEASKDRCHIKVRP